MIEILIRSGCCVIQYLLVIILFLCCLLSTAAWSTAFQQINFTEALRLALQANPRMAVSKAKIDAASAAVTEKRGSGLPKLNVEVNASRSNNPLTVFGDKLSQGNVSFNDFGFAQFTGPSSLNVVPSALNSPGYYNNWNTAVVLNVPIFSGGETLAKIKKAKSLLRAAKQGNQQAKTELTYDLIQAYEGVRTSEGLVQVARQALVAAETYVKLTKDLYQQSLVIESDVLLAETYRRSADATLKASIAERYNQIDTFHILIGQPDSHLLPGAAIHLALPRASMNKLENHAYFSNAQLQSLKSNVDAYRAEIHSASAHNWPQINLQLRHDWNSKTFSLSGSSNTAMLDVNWEIFSSGEQYGATKHALAEYKQFSAELDNTVDAIRLSVNQTVRAIHTAAIQLKSSERNAHQSIAIVRLLKQRYGQGVVTLGQLLDGQARLDTARAQKVIARYNLLLAKAKLLALINELNPNCENDKA